MSSYRMEKGSFLVWAVDGIRLGHAKDHFQLYSVPPAILPILASLSEPGGMDLSAPQQADLSDLIHSGIIESIETDDDRVTLPVPAPLLQNLEFELTRLTDVYPDIAAIDSKFMDLSKACEDYTLTSIPLQYALYSGIRHIEQCSIPGDVVECGVWRGGSMLLACHTLAAAGNLSRRIWMYDTFDWAWTEVGVADSFVSAPGGLLPAPTSAQSGTATDEMRLGAAADDVRALIGTSGYPGDLVVAVTGPIERTLLQSVPAAIALLRLDTDTYASTLFELETLYPKLSAGGVLIVDDYGKLGGATAAVDEYFDHSASPLLVRVDVQGRVGVKPATPDR